MTNDEIDRAIAGHLGADCMTGSRFATWPAQAGEMLRKITVHVAQSDERDRRLFAQIPNFSTDLNAMHQVEKAFMSSIKADEYLKTLDNLVNSGIFCSDYNTVTASAFWRAQAFLRTIGKWRDE